MKMIRNNHYESIFDSTADCNRFTLANSGM